MPGAPNESIGRALVFHEGPVERWVVPDETAQQWLAWLGSMNVGGFHAAPAQAGSFTVVRTLGEPLMQTMSAEPVPWRRACELVLVLARALSSCEKRKIRAGPIEPETLRWVAPGEQTALVVADSGAVRRLVDASPHWPPTRGAWRPPETPAGKPSSSADRYALGRLLYRLLCAEEPFSGDGLHTRSREPSPPHGAAAEALPAGLASTLLAMIDTQPRRRPSTWAELITRLEQHLSQGAASQAGADASAKPLAPASTAFGSAEMLQQMMPAASSEPGPVASGHPSHPPMPAASSAQMSSPARPVATPSKRRSAPGWLSGALAVAVAAPAAWFLSGMAEEQSKPEPSLRPATALVPAKTRPEDCGACHTRQMMEWRRSIMGQAARSPLFQSLEMLIEEQVARSDACPHGAGVLRFAEVGNSCTANGRSLTGTGGEGWCINCHSPLTNLGNQVPAWDGVRDKSDRRRPLLSMLSESQLEGIDCAFCHQVTRGVRPEDADAGTYMGNPAWHSFTSDNVYGMRPESAEVPGIANSAYFLDAAQFLADAASNGGMPHAATPKDVKEYRRSSEFCGTCHDVRLFGTDSIGIERGEHFKRLRNAYSEWRVWADDRKKAGADVYSCQDCHMSQFPGLCVADSAGGDGPDPGDVALVRACPPGTHFEPRSPGDYPQGAIANRSDPSPIVSHYFSSVDVPLTPSFPDALIEEVGVDAEGTPVGLMGRRDMLLGVAFRFELEPPKRSGEDLEIPLVMENVGAGHRVPAGFSQEREIWVHLRVTDADGELVYEVGRVDRGDEDLHDKIFEKVTVRDDNTDDAGQPLGLFGADVVDGPDVPQWDPNPELGGTEFRGKGLINLQNGFLRCVRCRGTIDEDGHCKPGFLQNGHRYDRFEDGDYDIDTGECKSNLEGHHRFTEVFFPVGSLDSERGVLRGPDAIIDTRSIPPDTPVRYTYLLSTDGSKGPFEVEARLLFRGFPPFLLRTFAAYEAYMTEKGERPDGPLLTLDVLERLEAVELHRRTVVID
ncbi:MAG: hypothetical protein AAF799_29335 [Myxococcota bacterium]